MTRKSGTQYKGKKDENVTNINKNNMVVLLKYNKPVVFLGLFAFPVPVLQVFHI